MRRFGEIRVGRALASTPARSRHRARGVLGHLIAQVEPPALPPSATLVVRALRRRAPRRWWLRPDPGFGRAVRSELAELSMKAARPARGPVPPDAPAVLFLDEAELWACLAADLLHGRDRWYWRSLFGSSWRRWSWKGWVGALAERPHVAIPALALLRDQGDDVVVAAALSARERRQLMSTVLLAAGVRPAEMKVVLSPSSPERTRPAEGAGVAHSEVLPLEPDAPPPWFDLVSVVHSDPEVVWLVAASVMAHRVPARLRRSEVLHRVARWLARAVERGSAADQAAPFTSSDPPLGSSAFEGTSIAARAPRRAGEPPSDRALEAERPRPVKAPRAELRFEQPDGDPPPAVESELDAEGAPAAPSPESMPAGEDAEPVSRDGDKAAGETREPRRASGLAEAVEAEPERAWSEDGARTRLAGVFYLIHLLDELYPQKLDDWTALEVLASGLLLDRVETRADALWAILAELAGRHPQDPPELESVPSLPEPWRKLAPEGSTSIAGVGPGAAAWFAAVGPHARARLRSALADVEAPELLVRPGRIFVTRTHVDVVQSIEAADVRIRRAGLDRDPGWRPGLRRVVQLHFM